jgi:hypothetical protein
MRRDEELVLTWKPVRSGTTYSGIFHLVSLYLPAIHHATRLSGLHDPHHLSSSVVRDRCAYSALGWLGACHPPPRVTRGVLHGLHVPLLTTRRGAFSEMSGRSHGALSLPRTMCTSP